MADIYEGFTQIGGAKDVISFKIHLAGVKAKKIPFMLLSKAQERLDVKQSINHIFRANKEIKKAEKYIKKHKFSEFNKQQRIILYHIRDAIQEGYNVTFINNVLIKRMLDKLKLFLDKHELDKRAIKIFEKFRANFRSTLAVEIRNAHGLEKIGGSATRDEAKTAALGLKVKGLTTLKSGMIGSIFRTIMDKRMVSVEFGIEKRAEKIEKKEELTKKEFYKLIKLLTEFSKVSKKLNTDIGIMTLYMLQNEIAYEDKILTAVENFNLPKASRHLVTFHENLRKKAFEVFRNEVMMLNDLADRLEEAKGAIREASPSTVKGKMVLAPAK